MRYDDGEEAGAFGEVIAGMRAVIRVSGRSEHLRSCETGSWKGIINNHLDSMRNFLVTFS